MRLKKIEIIKYRNFENITIDFEKNSFPDVYTIASKNGGGKSVLLQLIFIMLHAFMDEKKKHYLQQFLEEIEVDEKSAIDFIKFEITHQDVGYYLEFFFTPYLWESMNFNLFVDAKAFEKEIEINQQKQEKHERLLALKGLLEEHNRVTPLFKSNFREAENTFSELGLGDAYNVLRIEENQHKVVEEYQELIEMAMADKRVAFKERQILNDDAQAIQNELNALKNQLEDKNLRYISHIHNKNTLLLKTDMEDSLLTLLSTKIFLTAPSSQVFHFLKVEDKKEIFDSLTSYSAILDRVKIELNNFQTYDFASTDLILKAFQKSLEEDTKSKRKTGKYGTNYDDLVKELKDFLDNKEIIENIEGTQVIFKTKDADKVLNPEDLSHGELKRLGIYIWLKYLIEKDSIVLMDEVDIALHPAWQYHIVEDLTQWSKGSQFVLATHSPQIIGSTYYKNIIKLENNQIRRYHNPPVDRDINSIITQIMDAPDFPIALLALHKQYRKMVEEGKVKSHEAEELKKTILEYESENSSFFQDIKFDLEMT